MKRRRKSSDDKKPKGPERIGSVISDLMARRGYGQAEWRDQACAAWQETVGTQLGRMSCPGNLRRGVLEVTVSSSSVLQELTFQKVFLLQKIQQELPDAKIRDLRFRVGTVNNAE